MVFRASMGMMQILHEPAAQEAAPVLRATGMSYGARRVNTPALAAVSPKREIGPWIA